MTWLTNMSPTDQEESYYFPPELLTEIIARLPVKSILRFRCVSKYWLHRIPNPILISSHLHHISTIKYNTSSIYSLPILTFEYESESESKYFKIRMIEDFKQSVTLMTTPVSYHPLVSNDGLVLMLDDITKPKDLILVNPSLNTSLMLPTCPIPLTNHRVVYAIGFIPTADDFKIFAFQIPLIDTDVPVSAVYMLNRGCWTTRNIVFDKNYRLATSRVLFTKGKAHWWGRSHGHWKVVAFDIDSEKFSYIGPPLKYVDRVDGKRIHTVMDLFSLGGSVALWCLSVMFGFYIWVLDEVGGGDGDRMWRQLYHGVPTLNTIDFLLNIGPRTKFWFDDKCNRFYITNASQLLSYDFRRDEIKYMGYSDQRIRLADIYVESLLLCSRPGMDQPRT